MIEMRNIYPCEYLYNIATALYKRTYSMWPWARVLETLYSIYFYISAKPHCNTTEYPISLGNFHV